MMTQILSGLLDIAVPVFAVASMLSVGCSYTVRQIFGLLRNTRWVIRALVANFVLVPLLAYAVTHVLSLDRPLEIGLILIATAAGAPSLIQLTQAAEGDLALAAALLVLLLPVTVIYMPIVVPLAVPDAMVNASTIAQPLALEMLLPLGIGLLVRARSSRWAERLRSIMSKVSSGALLVLVATTFLLNLHDILELFETGAILAALLVIAGAFAIGYLLGGPDSGTRNVLGLGTGQRNIAAAIVVATQSFDDPDTLVMVVGSALMTLALLFPVAMVLRNRTTTVAATNVRSDATSRRRR